MVIVADQKTLASSYHQIQPTCHVIVISEQLRGLFGYVSSMFEESNHNQLNLKKCVQLLETLTQYRSLFANGNNVDDKTTNLVILVDIINV